MRVLLNSKAIFTALLLLGAFVLSSYSQAKPAPTKSSRTRSVVPKPTPEEPASEQPEPAQKVAACTLTLEQAPKLRGFYVNQPVDAIVRVFPSFRRAYEEEPLLPTRTLTSDFRTVDSDELTEDLSKFDEYHDVGFIWKLLNGRTVSLTVRYGEYEPADLHDFVTQVADTTGLPLTAFKVIGKHKASLTCDGFSMEVHEGSYTKTGWVANGSQILIEDTFAIKAMVAEEAEMKRVAAEEAVKKKEEAEKRKRTFKP
jgi:hypothetical protein